MKKTSLLLLLVICVVGKVGAQGKTKILVLGAYHMNNPGLDAFNMQADDVTLPKRQSEIAAFVDLLTRFQPTKICLEVSAAKNEELNARYLAYVSGSAPLRKNETDQIGFRLANQLKHPRVYAIDAPAPFEMDTVMKTAKKYQFTRFFEMMKAMPGFIEEENQKLRTSTVTEFFQHINSDTYNRHAHSFYLEMAVIGKDGNYAGADLVADWYKRNLRIYRNLMQLDLKPEDRVLILYGAGHTKILQDLVDDTPSLELVKLEQLR